MAILATHQGDVLPQVSFVIPATQQECRELKIKPRRGPLARRDLLVCIKAPAWSVAPRHYQLIDGKIFVKKSNQWVAWDF